MSHADAYALLDFGNGRKLERFGPYTLDRPAPAVAQIAPRGTADWQAATARYQRTGPETGVWSPPAALPAGWTVCHAGSIFELKPTPFGHVGLFPEQTENWQWLARQLRRAGRGLRVLNLFAYTGGATLAAAASGASVVHLDAARNVVDWARRNAELSRLSAAPIRWIVEDARKFVQRELRRGNRYDALLLDPPSYGHGPKGQAWKISQHLLPLLTACSELTDRRPALLLLSCHSPQWGPAELAAVLPQAGFQLPRGKAVVRPLQLTRRDGRKLASGQVVRWPA